MVSRKYVFGDDPFKGKGASPREPVHFSFSSSLDWLIVVLMSQNNPEIRPQGRGAG
jgi:hypothetical protein